MDGPDDYLADLKRSIQTVQRLDDSNPAPNVALGMIAYRYDWDMAEAEKQFRRMVELAPNAEFNGQGAYALLLSSEGRQDEAVERMRRAIEGDPFEMAKKANLGNIYTRAGQYDLAIDHLNRVAELNPDYSWTHYALTKAFAAKRMFPEAVAEARREGEMLGVPASINIHLAWVYARSGDRDAATKIIDEVMKSARPNDASREAFDAAGVYGELGNKDEAFAMMERQYAAHNGSITWLKVDPEVESLRGDPRYDDLLRRIGLSP